MNQALRTRILEYKPIPRRFTMEHFLKMGLPIHDLSHNLKHYGMSVGESGSIENANLFIALVRDNDCHEGKIQILVSAIIRNHVDLVAHMLQILSYEDIISARTPITWAVHYGNRNIMEQLVKKGLTQQDIQDANLIAICYAMKHFSLAKYLLTVK
jgi:hypothetical protein